MENEIPPVNRVDEIHEKLSALQGQKLKVKANMGRSRIVERTGTLVMAHPSLFIVEVGERRGRTARQSYQYVDVLTGTVELFDFETALPETAPNWTDGPSRPIERPPKATRTPWINLTGRTRYQGISADPMTSALV